MIKVRILERCEFCDGEILPPAILNMENGRVGKGRILSEEIQSHQKINIDPTVDGTAVPQPDVVE
jgi:hypothetical protein